MNELARRPPRTGWGSRRNSVRAGVALAQGVGAIGLAVLLGGCSTRILKEAEVAAPVRLDWTARDTGLALTLHHRITTNGPGSWVRDAAWDEYHLSIANVGSTAVEITAIELDGDAIATAACAGTSSC